MIQKVAIYRDVYLDGSTLLERLVKELYIYTDVLAFTGQEITISPGTHGTIQIVTRILTADAAVHLKVLETSCVISIYASVIDQPIQISTGDSEPTTLNLGPASGNAGVVITFS